MGVFFLFFIFTALIALFFNISQRSKANNKIYIYLCGIWIFLISAIRHERVGNDTIGYIEYYKSLTLMDWNSVSEEIEPGFSLLAKFLTVFSDNSTFFLASVAAIFTVSICFLIYKYSKDYFLSF